MSDPSSIPMDFTSISRNVLDSVQQAGFAGYDPFDSLNSTLLNRSCLYQNEWIRLVWLQLGKRLPVNLRPLLHIPKRRNPKGMGLFILGMIEDYRRTGVEWYLDKAKSLAEWLLSQRSDKETWQHACWGYHFDWQARAFFVPAGKPNIITTCYVARALYALGNELGCNEYIDIAHDSAWFIRKSLLTEIDRRVFFAYIPGETAFVHNASLWGSAWVAKVGEDLGENELCDTAFTVASQSVSEQCDNGAWVYGSRQHHQFIDGFHTGYNLEALDMLRRSLDTDEFDVSIDRGMKYYRDKFFLEDGTAKYYHDNLYPLDMHSFSQGVLTLLKVGGKETAVVLAQKIMKRAVETMYLPKEHRFSYQKHRWHVNKINYTRWTQAWAYYALAYYNRYMEGHRNEAH